MEKLAEPETDVGQLDDNMDVSIDEKHGTAGDMWDMKRMGKKQVFKRNFGFVSIFGFAMILMSTYESYLAFVGFALGNGGTAGMLYMFMAVGAFFFIVVLSMSEMASMAPTAGGQYHWVSEFAPRQYQRGLSFFVGWLCVLGWQTGCAVGCFLVATEIQGLVVLNNDAYTPQRWHGTLMSITMILVVAIFNTFLAQFLPKVEAFVLFLHLGGFFAIAIPLLVMGEKSPSRQVWTSFENAGNWQSTGVACLVGILAPITSLLGADSATHMSEELRDAAKVLPRAMICTTLFNGILGIAMAVTFCCKYFEPVKLLAGTLPVADVVGDVESVLMTPTGYPFIQVFYNATGSKAGATAMTCILTVLSTANAMTNMATASRQLFAFARDKGVPSHAWFAHVPQGWDIPLNAVIFTIIFPSILVLVNIGSLIAFNQLTSLGLCALLSSYLVSIGCVAVRRLQGQSLLKSKFSLGRWGLPVNLVSIAFLALALVMSFFPPMKDPTLPTMNWAAVVYCGVLAVAAVYYIFWARFVYVGPVEYVRKGD